jgi:nicotinamide riboside transporter PnuC
MQREFTVWFYIGVLLGVYGVLLTSAGIYQWTHPPQTVLAGEHATLWAGCILLVVGGGYTFGSWPRKPK